MNVNPLFSTRILTAITALTLFPMINFSTGCENTIANRDPTGETFPSVVGYSLENERTELPAALLGKPAVLLIGYVQKTQFDIDRWLMGLIQTGVKAPVVEIPTIPALLPTLASGWIDDGMRSGIPREDWGSVVTLYGEAAKPVAKLTGTQQAQLTRVIVLDAKGKIIWFDDKGFSPRKAIIVAELVASHGSHPLHNRYR